MIELSEQTIIAQVADRLTRKYPTIPADTVTDVVRGVYSRFHGRPVREFVPLLVERFSGIELDRLRSADRTPASQRAAGHGSAVVGVA